MPRLISVTDPDDPRLAPYRAIKERDLVGRDGYFIAEGTVVLRMLLASPRHRPVSVLLAERRAGPLMALLETLPADVPVYAARDEVITRIAGFSVHRGVLALGRAAALPDPEAALGALPETALVLVLIGIANHDNMGGIFRNAAGFGADLVLIDEGSCDPLYRKAIRVSVGGTLIVPFARLRPDTDVPALLARHDCAALALSPAGAARLRDIARKPRMALILGAEGPGLPAAILEGGQTLGIPMAPGFDSLNVATTSGIVLHYLRYVAS